jgi:hypothetical protein
LLFNESGSVSVYTETEKYAEPYTQKFLGFFKREDNNEIHSGDNLRGNYQFYFDKYNKLVESHYSIVKKFIIF